MVFGTVWNFLSDSFPSTCRRNRSAKMPKSLETLVHPTRRIVYHFPTCVRMFFIGVRRNFVGFPIDFHRKSYEMTPKTYQKYRKHVEQRYTIHRVGFKVPELRSKAWPRLGPKHAGLTMIIIAHDIVPKKRRETKKNQHKPKKKHETK